MGKIVAAAVCAASVLSVAGGAAASVLVIGNSLAGSCSRAAVGGARDVRTIDVCTRALQQEALDTRPLASTYVNRGVVRMRRGDVANARADFERAVEVDPRLGEAFVNRGSVHIVEGRLQEGLQDTNTGLSLGVKEPEHAYYNRAVVRELLADEKGAYLDYRKAASLDPDWSLPRTQLARFTVVRNPDR